MENSDCKDRPTFWREIGTIEASIWKPGFNFLSLPPPPPPNGCPLLINVFRCADGGPTLETSAIYSPKGLAHQPDQLLVGNPEFLPTDDMYSFQPQFVHPAQHKVRD